LYTKRKKIEVEPEEEIFQQLLRTKLPKNETQSVKVERDRFKADFTETTKEVDSRRSERRCKGTAW
jgi:hypothetical protein